MKKILAIFLLVMVLAVGTVFARDNANDPWKGSNGYNFPDVKMAGVSISSGTGVFHQSIGAGDILVYDVFVICTSSSTTGTVYLLESDNSTAILSLDVPAAAATGSDGLMGKTRSICPWARNGIPVKFTSGMKMYTSAAGVVAYMLFKN